MNNYCCLSKAVQPYQASSYCNWYNYNPSWLVDGTCKNFKNIADQGVALRVQSLNLNLAFAGEYKGGLS